MVIDKALFIRSPKNRVAFMTPKRFSNGINFVSFELNFNEYIFSREFSNIFKIKILKSLEEFCLYIASSGKNDLEGTGPGPKHLR